MRKRLRGSRTNAKSSMNIRLLETNRYDKSAVGIDIQNASTRTFPKPLKYETRAYVQTAQINEHPHQDRPFRLIFSRVMASILETIPFKPIPLSQFSSTQLSIFILRPLMPFKTGILLPSSPVR